MMRFAWPLAASMASLIILGVAVLLLAQSLALQAEGAETIGGDLAVSLSVSDISVLTGDTFTFTSEITNSGSDVTPPLIANLNIVSLDQSTYVDPEDWSPRRTLTVAPIDPGSSVTQSWTVNPPLKGDVAVYVVVLPEYPDLTASAALVASPAIHVHVEEHRTLNPGGVLPVVIAVPGVLALAFAGVWIARGRI